MNFAAIWVKRGQKAGFFAPDKFDNHTTKVEKERARKKNGVEEKKKKTVFTLLGFILATLEIIFVRNGEIGIGALYLFSLIPSDAVWSVFRKTAIV